jgi:hypothetical protein
MRYLCLIYNSADTDGRLSQAETDELVRDHFGFDDSLRRDGTLIHCDALVPPEEAVVLRLRNNVLSATDGPYIETKEHLAGFYVIEAASMADATEIAGRIPSARVGAVELRPIRILTLPQ